MFKSFLNIALRNLWRRKIYSVLNFVCLTFGLTCAIITMLYIRNVFSYDKFHKNYNRLFAVDAYVTYFNGDRFPKQYLSASLKDVLKVQSPEIEEITRIAERDYEFVNGDKSFTETGIYADENFFDVFTFSLNRSGSTGMKNDPNSILISEQMAVKFFGSTSCVGKTLIVKDGSRDEAFVIAGILNEVPKQSLMQFDFVIPFSKFLTDNKWALETGATANATWILLKQNADCKQVENKIRNLIKDQESTLNQELFMFPLKEQILYNYAGGKRVWKEMQNVVIIGTIGFAILLIACFNFINLAIAMNFKRYKEAGIRKVAGSGKSGIIIQFLGETFVVILISLFCAVILINLLIAGFNTMFHYDLHLSLLDVRMLAFLTAISMFSGLVSGLLPALYLASSNPLNALKGSIVTSHSYSFFRQSLIVFQFSIPLILIICMMIIRTQDRYMRNYDAGVDKDRVIVMNNSDNITNHAVSFKAGLLAIPGIDAVSFTNCIPTHGARVSSEVTWEGKDATEKLHFWNIRTDFDYDKVVKINLIDGRFFDSSYSTDSDSYVINDVAARVMKMNKPVGSSITVDGKKGKIIGVIKDFHAIDLAGPLVPAIIGISRDPQQNILIKYSSGTYPDISNRIRAVGDLYEKGIPYQMTLFRDLVPYSNLSLPSKLVGIAFIIAQVLACMGLFGLASFTSESRTKEIGIRKVSGATTLSVMQLLIGSYAKWLAIAFFIALPVAVLFGKSFLGKFYFHAPLPIAAFIIGPLIAVMVAMLTVVSKTWSVANSNPVKSLRYE